MTGAGYAALIAEPDYVERIAPDLWREALGLLRDIKSDTGAIQHEQARQAARQEELFEAMMAGFDRQAAIAAGVGERALVALARPIAEHVTNVDGGDGRTARGD